MHVCRFSRREQFRPDCSPNRWRLCSWIHAFRWCSAPSRKLRHNLQYHQGQLVLTSPAWAWCSFTADRQRRVSDFLSLRSALLPNLSESKFSGIHILRHWDTHGPSFVWQRVSVQGAGRGRVSDGGRKGWRLSSAGVYIKWQNVGRWVPGGERKTKSKSDWNCEGERWLVCFLLNLTDSRGEYYRNSGCDCICSCCITTAVSELLKGHYESSVRVMILWTWRARPSLLFTVTWSCTS